MLDITHPIVSNQATSPSVEAARVCIADIVKRHLDGSVERETVIPGLTLHGWTMPMEPASYLYEPSFAFIARGSKRVLLANEAYTYDESHFLLTAVGLPTVVQVLNATAANPYYSIKMNIDLEMARELIAEVDLSRPKVPVGATGMSIGPVTAPLATAVMRLVDMLDRPDDVPILARSVQREILYRVLTSSVGERLREAVQIGTHTNRVAGAIRFIRENFTQPIRVGELARIAYMGESTLHHHFRVLTTMSPLQYQKHLRLHEARRLMLNEQIDATSAAYRVGYESATQFNREYRRMFGMPPKSDVRQIFANGMEGRRPA